MTTTQIIRNGTPQPTLDRPDVSEDRVREMVGARLQNLRLALGATQRTVAGAAGLYDGKLSRIESGKTLIDVADVVRLARVYGVNPGVILADDAN